MNKPCRPLNDKEVLIVSKSFTGRFAMRNRLLFLLGCCTGFRISELLSIRIRDVKNETNIVQELTLARSRMKGKKSSRTVHIPDNIRELITELITNLRYNGVMLSDDYLFCNQSGKPITRVAAWKILKKAYKKANLTGNLATHTMRKTFANRIYRYAEENRQEIGKEPLIFAYELLGHIKIDSTMRYLSSCLTDDKNKAVDFISLNWLTE